jgi:hypothetical protein
LIFTILAAIATLALRAAGWPWVWAIVTGLGISFVVTTIGGYAIMVLMNAYGLMIERRERRKGGA